MTTKVGMRPRLLASTAAATLSLSLLTLVPSIGTPQAIAVTECATAVGSSPVAESSASGHVLSVSTLQLVHDPSGNPWAASPGAIGYDIMSGGTPARRISVPFSTHEDVGSAPQTFSVSTSNNGGATFGAASTSGIPSSHSARLRSGELLSMEFAPSAMSGSSATFEVHRSVDDGATWTPGTAVFNVPAGKTLIGIRLNEQPLELADGTILVTYYPTYSDSPAHTNTAPNPDETFRMRNAEVMQSTDGGATFTRRGVIATGTSTVDYSEAGIVQRPDGSLLSVIRTSTLDDFAAPTKRELLALRYSTSSDGTTWSAPALFTVSGLDGGTTAVSRIGINPQLDLLPNGVLVLSSGREDNWVAYSTTGAGTGWKGALTYRNCEDDTGEAARRHGSSGNTGLTSVASNRLIQTVDTCHNGQAYCHESDGSLRQDMTLTNQNQIWARFADVLTPDTGKIDLASKVAAGKIAVTTNMDWASTSHSRTRVSGAFDGSTEYWSSAVADDGAGSMVFQLDRDQRLTRIGLSLRNGRNETARVYTSMDGTTWGSPVVNATSRTHYALEYFPLSTPVNARYVKVEVDASSDCEPGTGTSCAFLNEVELYSTIDSFENDPLTNRPRGYTDLTASWVSESYADDSNHVLYFSDGSTTSQAKASFHSGATTTRTLRFKVRPQTIPNAMLFDIRGNNASGTDVAALHMGIWPDGSIRKYTRRPDGTYYWYQLANTPAGTIPMGQWSTIQVTASASTDNATLWVNDVVKATNMAATNTSASLDGHTFASGSSAATGDVFVIDDVLSE